jgi:hypothetical protein
VEGFSVAFYEEVPEAGRGGEAEVEAAVGLATMGVQSKLEPVFATEAGDVEDAVTKKQRVAWCYDSQIDEAATLEIAEFCRGYEGRERIWANSAWRDAGI